MVGFKGSSPKAFEGVRFDYGKASNDPVPAGEPEPPSHKATARQAAWAPRSLYYRNVRGFARNSLG
jgi:hypothetical protein